MKNQHHIWSVAIVHLDGKYQPYAPGAGISPFCRQIEHLENEVLPMLDQPCFAFGPVDAGCWVSICATTDNDFDDDRRRGTLSFALVFDEYQARVLLDVPCRLFALKEWLESRKQSEILAWAGGFDQWPEEVLAAKSTRQALGKTTDRPALQVMAENLLGHPSFGLCHGDGSELLALLCTLPMKLRLTVSLARPYISAFSTALFYFGVCDEKISDLPTRKRYDLRLNAVHPIPHVSDRAARLAETILDLRRTGQLDDLDGQARNKDELVCDLEIVGQMKDIIENRNPAEADKLLRREPSIPELVPYLDQEEQSIWRELARGQRSRHREANPSKEVPERPSTKRPESWGGLRTRSVVGALLAALIFGYGLTGTQVTDIASASTLCVQIQLAGDAVLQVVVGLVVGLLGGYLLFSKNHGGDRKL